MSGTLTFSVNGGQTQIAHISCLLSCLISARMMMMVVMVMMVVMMAMMMMMSRSVNGGQSQITHILCLLSGASLTPKSFDNQSYYIKSTL